MSDTLSPVGASSTQGVSLSPAEFGVLVDLALNANAPVGRVLQIGDLFQRASKLANQTLPIGAAPSLKYGASETAADLTPAALTALVERNPRA